VRFILEQTFSFPVEAVEDAFVDPALLTVLAGLPQLGHPELLGQTDDGDTVRQDVRYTFVGHLSPAVTRVVEPSRLTWVEHSRLDRGAHRSTFEIRPDHYADRLTCSGTVTLEPHDDGTRRTVEADLRVRVPLVASKVERAIVSGLREHAAAEAQVVEAWLDGR
jgi:uncharacterized protein YndB with AHSA1/START domain